MSVIGTWHNHRTRIPCWPISYWCHPNPAHERDEQCISLNARRNTTSMWRSTAYVRWRLVLSFRNGRMTSHLPIQNGRLWTTYFLDFRRSPHVSATGLLSESLCVCLIESLRALSTFLSVKHSGRNEDYLNLSINHTLNMAQTRKKMILVPRIFKP